MPLGAQTCGARPQMKNPGKSVRIRERRAAALGFIDEAAPLARNKDGKRFQDFGDFLRQEETSE